MSAFPWKGPHYPRKRKPLRTQVASAACQERTFTSKASLSERACRRASQGSGRRHTDHDRLARPGGLGNISVGRAFVRQLFPGEAIYASRPPYRSVVWSGRAKGGAMPGSLDEASLGLIAR